MGGGSTFALDEHGGADEVSSSPRLGLDRSRESVVVESAILLAGTVTDQFGTPALADVFVGSPSGIGELEAPAQPMRLDDKEGVRVPLDANGRFQVELPMASPVFCRVVPKRGGYPFERESQGESFGRWVTPPDTNVQLEVVTQPLSTIRVQVRDVQTQQALEKFRLEYEGPSGRGGVRSSADGQVVLEVPKSSIATSMTLRLIEPAQLEGGAKVVIVDGGAQDVVLEVLRPCIVSGTVVDESNSSVAGAKVFFGTKETVSTNDELFSAFQPERVLGAVTDENGRFRIEGQGTTLTVWHEEYVSVVVELAGCSDDLNVQLVGRSSIRGSLSGAWHPSTVSSVELDFEDSYEISDSGTFLIPNVDEGFHALTLPGGELLGVRVFMGVDAEVRLDEAIDDVTIALTSRGKPFSEPISGIVVGRGAVFTIAPFTAQNGVIYLSRALAGPHLLCAAQGTLAEFVIQDASTRLEVGASSLTVESVPGLRVFPCPEDLALDPLVHTVLRRLLCVVPPVGYIEFAPLLPSGYVLLDDSMVPGRSFPVEGEAVMVQR